jgi:hypothetical protein
LEKEWALMKALEWASSMEHQLALQMVVWWGKGSLKLDNKSMLALEMVQVQVLMLVMG